MGVPGPGRFITLEGGEGAGKSTQLRLLADGLTGAGLSILATREPGGSAGAEEIRGLLLGGGVGRWDLVTEALLMMAARRDHVERTVRPALAAGVWVVSDRFEDSTRAYQGAGSGLDPNIIGDLSRIACEGLAPDLTLILDLPVSMGRARAAARHAGADRFEQRDDAFHERVRAGFLAIAAAEPGRCAVIDATAAPAEVASAIRAVVQARLGISW